jgi:hypothetical protein
MGPRSTLLALGEVSVTHPLAFAPALEGMLQAMVKGKSVRLAIAATEIHTKTQNEHNQYVYTSKKHKEYVHQQIDP